MATGQCLVGAQDAADCDDQLFAAVADARIAEVPEIGQILANLGIGKAEQAAELTGTGGFVAVANQMLEFAQIKAQPIDDRLGGRPSAAGSEDLSLASLMSRFVRPEFGESETCGMA